MSDKKKDLSDPRINYRNDWVAKHGERKDAANAKSNQAQGKKIGRVKDADGGKVKTVDEHLIEGKEREGKPMAEKVREHKPLASQKDTKDIHLKSSTSLTEPETAKQNLKGASKANDFGKEKPPSNDMFRGSGGRGGTPTMSEPDEILKKKNEVINPEDILSKKKMEKPFEVAMNVVQKPVKSSSFMASLDAKIQKVSKNEAKNNHQKSPQEPYKPKQKGILAEIEKKVEAVKIAAASKSAQKLPKQEVAKQAPVKPIKRGR